MLALKFRLLPCSSFAEKRLSTCWWTNESSNDMMRVQHLFQSSAPMRWENCWCSNAHWHKSWPMPDAVNTGSKIFIIKLSGECVSWFGDRFSSSSFGSSSLNLGSCCAQFPLFEALNLDASFDLGLKLNYHSYHHSNYESFLQLNQVLCLHIYLLLL